MILPYGKLKQLADQTGLKKQYLNSVIRRDANISKARAVFLAKCCKRLDIELTSENWMFATTAFIKKRIAGKTT